MTSRDTSTDNLTGMMCFLLGAVTGAALAWLFAPATGKETREYIVNGARQARDQAAAAASKARVYTEQGRDAAVQAYGDLRSKIDQTLAQGRETLEQGKATVSRAMEEGREAYQRIKTGDDVKRARQA
jgi:gas vesicle protein